MKISEGIAIIEAVLFACGDPISIDKLADASGLDRETVAKLIDQLERRYNVSESGLRIIRLGSGCQITTRREYAPYIKSALESKRQAPLSQAAMEVLAIIAYNQPVTKTFVEQVRGIDSNSVVNTLAERDLVEEAGRLELPGRPIAYRTTDTFLRSFGLSSLGELPPLPDKEGQLSLDTLEEIYAPAGVAEGFTEGEVGELTEAGEEFTAEPNGEAADPPAEPDGEKAASSLAEPDEERQ